MRHELSAYIDANTKLLKLFGCESALPIRVLTNVEWRIQENEGVSFLHYRHKGTDDELVSVIINKDSEPWVTPLSDVSLVVAIDCIRFAFILNNELRR